MVWKQYGFPIVPSSFPPDSDATRPSAPGKGGSFARLRIGLLALLALVAVGLAVFTGTEILRNHAQADAEAVRQAENLAKTLELHAQGVFRTADLAAATLAEAVALRPGVTPMNDGEVVRLTERLLAGGALRSLAVADAEGRVRVDTESRARGMRADDRSFFQFHRAEQSADIQISHPFISRSDRGWVVVVSRRIEGEAGAFGGVAWATVDLGTLKRFYASLDVGPGGSVTLLTPDGYIVAGHPHHIETVGNPTELAAAIRERIGGQREGVLFGASVLGGSPSIIAFRAVEGLPLYVSVRLAEEDYLAGWRRTVQRQVAEAFGGALIIAVLTVLLLRHLRRLEATTRALRDSEWRARAIFDSTYQYMALMRPDGGMLAINRAGMEFGGAGAGEGMSTNVVGCPAWKMRAWRRRPETAERFRLAVHEAAAGGLARFEAELDTGDGLRTVDCSVKPVRDAAGRIVLLIAEARDITERKHAEDSLRRSEVRLRSYLDAAMEGIVVTDADGRYIEANPAACQMLGYTRDELLALRVPDVVTEVGAPPGSTPACLTALRSAGEYRGEIAMRRRDGGFRLAEINAVVLDHKHCLGVIRDVTERKRAEEQLRTSTARLAALVEALPDIAFIVDAAGHYREILAPHSELLVAPVTAMLGRRLAEVLPAEVAAVVEAAIAHTLETGEPQTVEYRLSVPAGRRWFEGRMAPLPRDFGPEPMVLLLARDVTERVLAAERLAQAKEQAESAHRIKSNFLATMSHELRTPLNAIIGFSEVMVHRVFGPLGCDRYGEYARHIHQSGTHLLDLINDVLDMSKLEAGRYTLDEREFRLEEVLESCLTVSAVPAQAGAVELIPALAPSLPRLRADERALRQIVLNLLSNAVKFTPSGGRVTLCAGLAPDGELEIAVTDTGIGIEPEALDVITEPFQQADNSISRRFGGTGLGLAICRNLMELHGGTLAIDSTVGQGTTVTARFPAERVVRKERVLEAVT